MQQVPLFCSEIMLLIGSGATLAGGGPLGIDHQLNMHDSGIWKRSTQNTVFGLAVTADVAAALWEGGDPRLGKTLWQSVDSTVLASAAAGAGKLVFFSNNGPRGDFFQQWPARRHKHQLCGAAPGLRNIKGPFLYHLRKSTHAKPG